MKNLRFVSGSVVAVALIAGSVAPAAARGDRYGFGKPGYGYGYDRRYRHRDRGISAGDVIAGVAVIGVLAAIAGAASKNRRDRDQNGIRGESEAADACAIRAEQRFGDGARARIDDVFRTRDGYDVRGSLERRDQGYGDRADDSRFTCTVRFGRVEDVRFEGGYALRGF